MGQGINVGLATDKIHKQTCRKLRIKFCLIETFRKLGQSRRLRMLNLSLPIKSLFPYRRYYRAQIAERRIVCKYGGALMTVVSFGQLNIIANYRETSLAHIKAGQPVDITVDAFPDFVAKGMAEGLEPDRGSYYSPSPCEYSYLSSGTVTKITQ